MKNPMDYVISGQPVPPMSRFERLVDRVLNDGETLHSEFVVLGRARFVQKYGERAARRFAS